MAKCVVCTTLNAVTESNRHSNGYTRGMADALGRRWDRTPKTEKARYCSLHSESGTGRATEENAVRIIAEREREKAEAQTA